MKEHRYTVFFGPTAEGGHIVHVPAMREICTEGDTLEEARSMAADATHSAGSLPDQPALP
jgi:predicted RNase H-like HicB family nuclease